MGPVITPCKPFKQRNRMLFNWLGTFLFILMLVSVSLIYRPDDADMVRLWIRSGNVKKALELIEKSDFRESLKPGALKLRGLVNEKAGNIIKARKEYTLLLKHRTSENEALKSIYRIELSVGELDSAYKSLKKLFENRGEFKIEEILFLLSQAIKKREFELSSKVISKFITGPSLYGFKKDFFQDYENQEDKYRLLLLLDYQAESLTASGDLKGALDLYMKLGRVSRYAEYLSYKARDNMEMLADYLGENDKILVFYQELFKNSIAAQEKNSIEKSAEKPLENSIEKVKKEIRDLTDYNALNRHIILARKIIDSSGTRSIKNLRLEHVGLFWKILIDDLKSAVENSITDRKYFGMTYNRYMALRNAAFLFQTIKDGSKLTGLYQLIEKSAALVKNRGYTFYQFELFCDTAELMINAREYARGNRLLDKIVPNFN